MHQIRLLDQDIHDLSGDYNHRNSFLHRIKAKKEIARLNHSEPSYQKSMLIAFIELHKLYDFLGTSYFSNSLGI